MKIRKFYSLFILAVFAINAVSAQSSISADGTTLVIDLDVATPLSTQYDPDIDKYNHIYNIINDIYANASKTSNEDAWNAVTSVTLKGDAEYSWLDLRAVRNRFLKVQTFDLTNIKLLNKKIQGQLTWGGSQYTEFAYPGTNTGAFYDLPQLQTVLLPADLEIIGKCAFANCSNLTNLDLPGTLKTIDTEAFRACSKLTIPNGLPSAMSGYINNSAFYNCYALELTGAVPANLRITQFTQIFENCTKVAFSSINGIVTSDKRFLGNNLFYNTGVSISEIPEGIYSVQENCFSNCPNITEITFPLTFGQSLAAGPGTNWQEVKSSIGSKVFALPAGSPVSRTYIFKSENLPTGGVTATAFNKGEVVDDEALVLVPNATAVTNFIAIAPFNQMNVRAKENEITITLGANGDISTTYGTITDNKINAQYGDDITFSLIPANGYIVDEVTLDGAPVTPDNNSVTFTVSGKAARVPGHDLSVTFKSPVSIDDVDVNDITAYINSGIVNVVNADGAEKAVYDSMGRLVIKTTENQFSIDNYTNGVYIIKVNGKSIKMIKK